MGALLACLRSICYIFGLSGPPKSLNNKRTNISYEEESRGLNVKSTKQYSVTDIVEDNELLIKSPKKQQNIYHIPTKDEPSGVFDLSKPLPKRQESKPFTINTESFKINLEGHQKFFSNLQTKTKNLKDKINFDGTGIELQTTLSNLVIRHQQSGKLNIFVYKFKLPCSYQFYNQMLNDYNLQKKFDSNIDEYKMLQLYSDNFRLNYLSYKKVLIVSPRDLAYVKYSTNQGNQNWDISFSVPHENIPQKVRAQIILNCCKITEKSNQQIEIQVYTQVDMKLSVTPKITKNQSVNQIKKYVDKCYKYIKENYKAELI